MNSRHPRKDRTISMTSVAMISAMTSALMKSQNEPIDLNAPMHAREIAEVEAEAVTEAAIVEAAVAVVVAVAGSDAEADEVEAVAVAVEGVAVVPAVEIAAETAVNTPTLFLHRI